MIVSFLKHKATKYPRNKSLKESAPVSLRGSLSLEAGMVIPIFLFFMMTILLGIEMVRLQTNVFEALHEEYICEFEERRNDTSRFYEYLESKNNVYLCADGGVNLADNSTIDTDGYINLTAEYAFKPFIYLMPLNLKSVRDTVYGHSFTGFSDWGSEYINEGNEYVYVTATGVKYHRSPDCSYIKVSPRAINASELDNYRNSSGGKYYPCRTCHAKKRGTVYITGDGSAYHQSANCSALKRSVRIITLKEAEESGYTPCSKCG